MTTNSTETTTTTLPAIHWQIHNCRGELWEAEQNLNGLGIDVKEEYRAAVDAIERMLAKVHAAGYKPDQMAR